MAWCSGGDDAVHLRRSDAAERGASHGLGGRTGAMAHVAGDLAGLIPVCGQAADTWFDVGQYAAQFDAEEGGAFEVASRRTPSRSYCRVSVVEAIALLQLPPRTLSAVTWMVLAVVSVR